FSVLDKGHGAIAVPFDFEQPLWSVEWLVDRGGEHGTNFRGHGALDGCGRLRSCNTCNRKGRRERRGFWSVRSALPGCGNRQAVVAGRRCGFSLILLGALGVLGGVHFFRFFLVAAAFF